MLRNLLDEVRSRRLLAFAALGVLVALAVPLLFLKSAPQGAPEANTAAPAAAEEAKLPARAARLLATSDAGTAGGHANGSSQDPFDPPAAYRAAIAAAAKPAATTPASASAPAPAAKSGEQAGGASKGLTSPKPIPVVIENPGATKPSTGSQTAPSGTTKRTSSLTARNASVDIRFGPKADTRIRRAIQRQKALYIHGKLVAVFVKYSPSRKAAVFAVAPGLRITGDGKCRVKDGACRYLDIPAGGHAWLTTATPSRTIVSRRLDVVRIKRRSASSRPKASAARSGDVNACLLRKLLAMEAGDAPVDRDACKN
ncbi:MAG: hypothetical protein WKF96_13265 [Solirubrobacteraceae bacterium]